MIYCLPNFRVYLRGHLSSDNKINHLSKIGGTVRRPALACCSLIEISKQRLYSAKVQSTKLERTLINQQQNKEDGTKNFHSTFVPFCNLFLSHIFSTICVVIAAVSIICGMRLICPYQIGVGVGGTGFIA